MVIYLYSSDAGGTTSRENRAVDNAGVDFYKTSNSSDNSNAGAKKDIDYLIMLRGKIDETRPDTGDYIRN